MTYDGTLFGQWVRERRKARDMTQKELAGQIGCSEATLRKFEAGTRRPSRQIVERLTHFFGLSSDDQQRVMAWARLGVGAGGRGESELLLDIGAGVVAIETQRLPAPSNLPTPLTSLIGRERELADATSYLLREGVRLLTLTGPPGVGKTRLAIATAGYGRAHYADGVYFVPLVSVRDPALVPAQVAQTLGLPPSSQEQPLADIKATLRERRTLLVLDNFEQVVQAAPAVVELLEACPHLCVLVTSREALRVRGEQQMAVRPLPLPGATQATSLPELAAFPSIALFAERARGVNPDFNLTESNAAAVADLCTRLDGLPLAIELAAAQARVLSPQDMLARLGSSLTLLSDADRDFPPQHRTLLGAIGWSYEFLPPREQILFAYLSVFIGGFSLESAEAIAGHILAEAPVAKEAEETRVQARDLPTGGRTSEVLAALKSLLDKSLIQGVESPGGELRFTILDTIREYAAERLDRLGNTYDARTQHAHYYLTLVEKAEPELIGQEQVAWLERLEQEHQNLRAALQWTLVGEGGKRKGDVETGARIAGALVRFWDIHGHWSEGRRWLEEAVQALNSMLQLPSEVMAKVLLGAGRLASFQDDRDKAQAYFTESLTLYRRLDNLGGMTEALNGLALLAAMRGDRIAARDLLEESLGVSRSTGDLRSAAKTLANLGQLTIEMGDFRQAEVLQTESLGIFRGLGDKWGMAVALENMGQLAAEQGDYERSNRLLQESLLLTEELGDKARLSWVLGDLGIVGLASGDYENAIETTVRALELYREMGDKNGQGLANYILGVANLYRGALEDAALYFTQGLLICRQIGEPAGCAPAIDGLAAVALRQGDRAGAARLLGVSFGLRENGGYRVEMVERPLHEHTANEAQNTLGSKAFRRAWAEGRAIPVTQAITYALGRLWFTSEPESR